MRYRAPEVGTPDPALLADWTELCVLCGAHDEIPRGEIEDYFRDFGPIGTPADQSGEDEYSDDGDFSPDAAIERLVDDVLRHLEGRTRAAGDWYPVFVDDGVVSRRCGWEDVPAHVSLVLADISRHYKGAELPIDSPFRLLFEHVTAAGLRTLLGPTTIAGTSRRADEELGEDATDEEVERVAAVRIPRVVAAIKDAAEFFGLPMKATDDDVRASDKDLGLDVLSRVHLTDERAGGLYMLTQCATAIDWHRTKRGEPSLTLWAQLIGWDGMQMSALAVPYRVDGRFELKRYSLRCQAVILDRSRIIMSNPDEKLGAEARNELRAWCGGHLENLPPHVVQ